MCTTERVIDDGRTCAFVVHDAGPRLVLTQNDVRQIQLAKGALYAGCRLLMGAVAGGRCNSAGMRAAQEATRSTVPAISYPVTFAISNVILTLLAYVMAIIG